MGKFQAIVVDKGPDGQAAAFKTLDDTDLMDVDVTVRVTHSSVNYKDGLAVTGKAPVIRRFPMIPGVDFAGIVETSSHPDFKTGDAVLLNTWGVGDNHFGGYAQKARVKGDWLLPLPSGLKAAQAMAIGTAGLTSMLCIMALEHHRLTPGDGPVVVTGAAGGVGSIAVMLLAKAGWHVIASTGRPQEAAYLKDLGAAEIIDRNELSAQARPLNKERWIAGVDTVGSHTLANVLSMVKYGGAVAACGMVQGMDLQSSVAPFILRGVTLIGIDSVMIPKPPRIKAWRRIADQIDRRKLDALTSVIKFDQVIEASRQILDGKVRGRLVVDMA